MAKPASKRASKKPVQRGLTAKEYSEFSKAHQNVLLEHMDSQFRALAEGHGILRDKLEALDAKLDAKVDGLDAKVDKGFFVLGEKIEKVEGRLYCVEEVVAEILQRLKSLESRVTVLEARMGGLESKWETAFTAGTLPKDCAEKIRQLEERVAVLESHAA